ncbi:SDR family NAD(P)-dependent oxidoreductase [Chryseobacterium sp. B21-037]|uniref:SDR family NAD(P)-dependent oxidoreductase n=1 Tax=unclassified Chryseobacterium TaxID=2593645 RepID=UPI00235A10A6|nr:MULTISPECIES: SDR family NAD(P)-dependent oxidoreductase [unclassified Chryseobacterium]MDC8104302.1 SDR family NAD(P)-dependent oxidoreductase [Chryseobacterium sp. B21-037]MDQ1803913.1 SDR family NAD(P)-dependent oxidoreductase [Chryseobacterium sp. CKR4-1]
MDTKESFAVVTGASQGLGKAFVENLAKKKINVILISLPGQNVAYLSEKIAETYDVKTHYYEIDLSINENVMYITEKLNRSFNIHILINNAGLGGTRKFVDATPDYINTILQVNVMATSLMTHQLLPNLLKQPKAYILNVSSMAAFSPIGFKTVYPASKTFIHSFSRGLHEELKDTNVFVSVVNPGAMKTNKDVCERIEKQGFLGKLTLLDPNKVAARCVNQLFKRDSVIMVNPISWLVMKILPIWIKLPLMTNAIKKEIEA